MNKLIESIIIAAARARFPGLAKQYDRYEKYLAPLIRARRYYKHNRKAGMSTEAALMKAAEDAHVPYDTLIDYLKDKTGDFGEVALSSLTGTTYDPTKTNYKADF